MDGANLACLKEKFNPLKSGRGKLVGMTIAKRITKARQDAEMSKSELARVVGVTPSSVTQWESGETKSIEGENLAKIAVATGVDAVWLATGKAAKHKVKMARSDYNVTAAPLYRQVPLISWVQAGTMKDIQVNFEPGEGDRWESPTEKEIGKRGFALVVEGDSMDDGTDRAIPAGWLIFVDPDMGYFPNAYVIAKDVQTQRATFKKLTTDGGRWYLTPLNKQYQAIEIESPDLRIIGVVTEARPPSRKLI